MNTQTLQIGSWAGNKAVIEPNRIYADAGLDYPRIIIPVKLLLNPIKDYENKLYNFTILNVQASLHLDKNSTKISDSVSDVFAYNVLAANSEFFYNLEFPLDQKRIIKIEENRRTNLSLQMNVHFLIAVFDLNYPNKIENSLVQFGFEIEQSYWVNKLLPQLSFGEYFIIEIPKGKKYLEDAWSYIEKAEYCYKMWDTKGAFANCREVGTILELNIKQKLNGNPNYQKWKRSFELFKHLTSLYLHIEDVKGSTLSEKIVVNKNDTEYILLVTKAILKHTEGLLRD
jgi:hypothetical protein